MIDATGLPSSLLPPTGRRSAVSRPAATPVRTPNERDEDFLSAALVSEQLLRAERAVRAGEILVARRLCAATILDQMPLLASSQPLLERTIAILLHCRAFGQISRLLAATRGHNVLFQISEIPGCVMPPMAKADREGRVVYRLNARQLTVDLADSVARRWSVALVAGRTMVSHDHRLTS